MANNSIRVNNGLIVDMNRAFKVTPDYTAATVFKAGILNATPNITDTDLTLPVPITGTETVDDLEATTGWSTDTDSAISLNTTNFKEGSNSLNVAKTGTSGTTFSTSKTVTSLNFTSKDVSVWVRVATLADLVATGTAFTIQYGSDSSNHYNLDVNITSLSAGFNFIVFNSSTATSTTGSPVDASMDFFKIIFNVDLAADLVAAGDVSFDIIRLISSDDYTKTFEAGFPTLDESTFEATTKLRLDSTNANGFDINGIGTFNTDGTPKMTSEDTLTAESKDDTDEFIYNITDRYI